MNTTQGASGSNSHFYQTLPSGAPITPQGPVRNDKVTTSSDNEMDADPAACQPKEQSEPRDLPPPPKTERSIVLSTHKALSEFSAGRAEMDSFALMALMTTAIREQRSGARQTRSDELQAELKFKRAAADTMRKGISSRMWGGIISGASTALGGLISAGGASISGVSSYNAKKDAQLTKPVLDSKTLNPPVSPPPPASTKTNHSQTEPTTVQTSAPKESPVGNTNPDQNTRSLDKSLEQQNIEAKGIRALRQDLSNQPDAEPVIPSDSLSTPVSTKADQSQTAPTTTQASVPNESPMGNTSSDLNTKTLSKSLKQRKIEAQELENWNKDLSNQLHVKGYWANGGEGFSKSFSGGGSAFHAFKESSATESDAKKTDEEASAKAHEVGYQQSNEIMSQTQELLRELREKLSAVLQSEVETTRAINRNI